MQQRILHIMFTLLALLGSTAWAFADQKVTIVSKPNGVVTADKQSAEEGLTVTLTVTPADGYRLKNGALFVEKVAASSDSDGPGYHRSTSPQIGAFVAVTRTSANTYTFVMPASDVEVWGIFEENKTGNNVTIGATTKDGLTPVTGVTAVVSINGEGGGVRIEEIIVPGELYGTEMVVQIPSTVVDAQGKELAVVSIASHALYGQTGVTCVVMPETDKPITIEEGAFKIDDNVGEAHRVVIVRTPLALLADYALMSALSENYLAGKVKAMAKAVHRYWTFSCGVDVRLPKDVTFYSCRQYDEANVELIRIDDEIIKANNGVLMACADDEGHVYEMVASPNENLPSGSVPSIQNARSYAGNLLEPVIRSAHFSAGTYFVISNNAFYAIAQENTDIRIPACKAVLHLQGNAQYSKKMNVMKRAR